MLKWKCWGRRGYRDFGAESGAIGGQSLEPCPSGPPNQENIVISMTGHGAADPNRGVLRLPGDWSGSVLGRVQGFELRTVGMLTA